MPILINYRSILLVHKLTEIVSAKICFAIGVISVCVASTIGFARWDWTGTYLMFRHLNNVSSKIPWIVSVTLSGSIVRLPCASLMAALFNSYPELLLSSY